MDEWRDRWWRAEEGDNGFGFCAAEEFDDDDDEFADNDDNVDRWLPGQMRGGYMEEELVDPELYERNKSLVRRPHLAFYAS